MDISLQNSGKEDTLQEYALSRFQQIMYMV